MTKRLRFSFLVIAMSILSLAAYSQDVSKSEASAPNTLKRIVSVGPFILGDCYTDEQIADITGLLPTLVHDADNQKVNLFIYENDRFYTFNDELYCFDLQHGALKLNGIVGPGDELEKIYELKPHKVDVEPGKAGCMYYYVHLTEDPKYIGPITFYVENGIINRVTYLKEGK